MTITTDQLISASLLNFPHGGRMVFATTASYAEMIGRATSASFADSAILAQDATHSLTSDTAISASFADSAILAQDATHSLMADTATSASHAVNADSALGALTAVTSSLATEALSADYISGSFVDGPVLSAASASVAQSVATLIIGNFDPVVTGSAAAIGSLFSRTDIGTSGSLLYLKTGSADTDWLPIA